MATIGAYTVDTMIGRPLPAGASAENITRRGINGVALRLTGTRPNLGAVRTTSSFTTAANMNTAINNYYALLKTAVTVVDGYAISHTNQLVEFVALVRARRVGARAGCYEFVATVDWVFAASGAS